MLRYVLSRLAMGVVLLCLPGTLRAAAVDAFTAPSGGEIYILGQVQRIHISRGILKTNVLLELSRDNGAFETLGTITGPSATNSKEFVFDYSVSGAASGNVILRASGTTTKGKITVLSQPFAIAAANVTAGGTIPVNGVMTTNLADGSVTTPKLADGSVTAAKQNSGAASSGFVLTADGSGGAQYQAAPTSSGVPDGSITNASVSPAAAIAYSKLNLSNSIIGGDIKNASILYSKLNLNNSITSADIQFGTIADINVSATAGIQYTKLNLTGGIARADIQVGAIVDALVDPNAAIAYSKLNLAASVSSADIKPGTLVDSNVSPSAGIQYSKLSLANSVAGSDIKAGAVTNANISPAAAIVYSKLNLSNSIQGSDLAPGTITPDKLSTAGATAGQTLVFDGTNLAFGSASSAGFTLPIVQNANSTATLFDLTNASDAPSGSFTINNATAVSAALQARTAGTGAGVFGTSALGDGVLGQSNSGAAVHGKKTGTDSGSAGIFENTNGVNTSDILRALSSGSGLSLHAIASGPGTAATFEATNSTNTLPAATVANAGLGDALQVNVSNTASLANGITVSNTGGNANTGGGDGVNATSSNGNGVTGVANSFGFASGVEGDNNGAGPGVLGLAGTGYGAVMGVNFAPGAGIFGYSLASGGFGIFGFGGINDTQSIAGHFESRSTINTANTVEVLNAGTGPTLSVSSSSATAGQGVVVSTATGAGGTALKVGNGAVAFAATNGYASLGVVDNAYLIVTTQGSLTLSTAATLADGATVWVVNNSGGAISVSNTTSGAVSISAGNAKQFLFIKAVSTINWITVQQ